MPPTLLLDVDGTLAPFDYAAAAEKVREILVGIFRSKGEQASKDFLATYEAINSLHHGRELPEFVRLRNKLNSYGGEPWHQLHCPIRPAESLTKKKVPIAIGELGKCETGTRLTDHSHKQKLTS